MRSEQFSCALQPAAGHGVVTAKRIVVPRQPDRDATRGTLVASLSVQPEGILASAENRRRIVQPPGGERAALQRQRIGRTLLEQGREDDGCLGPLAAFQREVPSSQRGVTNGSLGRKRRHGQRSSPAR